MNTDIVIKKLLKDYCLRGTVLNHGRKDWQVLDCHGAAGNFNAFLATLRKMYPFEAGWIINANHAQDQRREPR